MRNTELAIIISYPASASGIFFFFFFFYEINSEFQCESGRWRQSLKEILIIRFEINGVRVAGLPF